MKGFAAAVSLTSVSFLLAAAVMAATPLPSEADVAGIESLCGGGTAQIAAIQSHVDAAIKGWKNASAGVDAEAAKKNLVGVLTQVKTDEGTAKVYETYVDCVNRQIDKWIDREANKPVPISAEGTSDPLLRSNFTSDDQIRDKGCSQAASEAMEHLQSLCPNGNIQVLKEDCSSNNSSPRTYRQLTSAQCSPKHS